MFVYYVDVSEVEDDLFQRLLKTVSLSLQHDVLKYRYNTDRYFALFGKLLLRHIYITQFNLPDPLNRLQITRYGKPFVDDDLCFNISHSGKYVVCAVSHGTSIGVDIEKYSPLIISDFKSVLNDKEWSMLEKLNDPQVMFYDLWAIKESVIKANGFGLSLDLKKIQVYDSTVYISHKNETLYYKRLQIDEGYASAIASYDKISSMDLKKISSDMFLP